MVWVLRSNFPVPFTFMPSPLSWKSCVRSTPEVIVPDPLLSLKTVGLPLGFPSLSTLWKLPWPEVKCAVPLRPLVS